MNRSLRILTLAAVLAVLVHADSVYLKTGYVMLGAEVLEIHRDYIHVRTDRLRRIPADNINKIVFVPQYITDSSAVVFEEDIPSSGQPSAAYPAEVESTAMTVFLRNETVLTGTVRIDNEMLSVTDSAGKRSQWAAGDVRKVVMGNGYPLVFGVDDGRFIVLTSNEYTFPASPNDALIDFGVGIARPFSSSRYTFRTTPSPVTIDDFGVSTLFTFQYSRRMYRWLFVTGRGEYSLTRFTTPSDQSSWEHFSVLAGIRLMAYGNHQAAGYLLMQYGYSFADMPGTNDFGMPPDTKGPSLRYGIGFFIHGPLSAECAYTWHHTRYAGSPTPKQSLKSVGITLYYAVQHIDE